MAMTFQKQPSKFIKPLVPAPSNLKHYKLGFIDEVAPSMDIGIVLFFTKNSDHDPAKFVVQLEKSLEKTLTRLYPLAGRYVEESQTIDCNDEGVEFIQAEVSIKLEDIIGNSEVNIRSADEFIHTKGKRHDVVLTIQMTTFECGGVALGVCATHKIADVSTLSTFLNEWAAMNRKENKIEFTGPGFISSSLFPARGVRAIPGSLITDDDFLSKYTIKKLSFSESAISNMIAKATNGNTSTRRFSKVQLVAATIWKAFIGVDRVTHDYARESVLCQPVNLRERMASSIPKYSCGNIWVIISTKPTIDGTIEELAYLANDSVRKTIDDFSKVHHDSEQGKMMVVNYVFNLTKIPESTNVIALSSWCKFPFYEADFGFGKPIWAVPWITPFKSSVVLIDDARGNGVEAYITLEVKDVPSFEEGLDADVLNA